MQTGKIYFASDFHLGTPDHQSSLQREKKIVRWLDQIKDDAEELYLMGDIFDFWFEYKKAVPKGYIRLMGKLAELRDNGLPVYFFTGNHDLWMFGYFEKELGIPVYHQPLIKEINEKMFYLAHGDGLGAGDKKFKAIKNIFKNKMAQKLFRWLHPDIGITLAGYWSKKSRQSEKDEHEQFLGEDKEMLIGHARKVLKDENIDYFVFGHRHIMLDFSLDENSRLINLGDWLNHYSYGVFDGKNMELKQFEK